VPAPRRVPPPRRRPATDRELLTAWLFRAVAGCVIFGGVSALVRDQPVTPRNIVAYGILFGVLVATLHFLVALYQRRKLSQPPKDGPRG